MCSGARFAWNCTDVPPLLLSVVVIFVNDSHFLMYRAIFYPSISILSFILMVIVILLVSSYAKTCYDYIWAHSWLFVLAIVFTWLNSDDEYWKTSCQCDSKWYAFNIQFVVETRSEIGPKIFCIRLESMAET